MKPLRTLTASMHRWLLRLLCLLALAGGVDGVWACTGGACVSAGPRLASVNTANGTLLNGLLGNLTGSTLSLNVADWNAIATGDVSLASSVNALQATLGVSSPSTALATNASVAQILTAAATAATGEGKTSLALALNSLQAPLTLLSGTIRLGDLLQSDGGLGTTRINALELVTGVIQLYNTKNVVATPSALALSTASLGLSGIASSVTLAAQVVEPPVFVCGGVGSTFHTATVRVKLGIDLLSISLDASLLKLIPLVTTASISVGHLDLYLEIAHGDGIISALNALSNAFSVQATPGVASLYLGTIDPNVFFNRSHTLNAATDLTWGTIGAVTINSLSVGILVKASASASASSATPINFTGPYPQSTTVSTGAIFIVNLLSSLAGNLQLNLTAGLGALTSTVAAVLQPIVQLALPGIVQPLVDGLVDPLLGLLGIGIGEMVVNADGTYYLCSISGAVYADADHSARKEASETGTGATLYAKLVPAAQPAGPALAVATVDPSTGAYSFSSVTPAGYLVVVNGSALANQVAGAAPAGWIGTETPTQSLALTLGTVDLAGRNFGLYHGSLLKGTVFRDDGTGSGTANNGVRDGTEATIVDAAVKVTDAGGATLYDTTKSGDAGTYALWVPYTATGALKVVHGAAAEWIAISGNVGTTAGTYTQASASVAFAFASGNTYSGVNFGDVPANRFEPDGQQQLLPGAVAFFAHTYTAGSAGQASFTLAGSGANGWTSVLYADANCNGRLDAGELPLTAAIGSVAGQKICLIVKVSAPASAAYNAQYTVTANAHFVYANNSLTADQPRTDIANTGSASDSGLRLSKVVDKAVATSGDVITYTMTYTNQSAAPLGTLKVLDSTPAYTVFASAACGSLPGGLMACAVTAAPAAGASGRVEWTFTGSLTPGASGTVTFKVVLQ
jgi:uncharacterized repeat protein (TIGR01451 family)